MKKNKAIEQEAKRIGVEEAALRAFIDVESGGSGFDAATGKLIIQFEPAWFRKKTSLPPPPQEGECTLIKKWDIILANKVEGQAAEWRAFNAAFSIDANAAMESTSIGIGQVMGFHYKRLGYATVGAMWDDAKRREDRQIFQMAEFIRTDARLIRALKAKNWHLVATYYNGGGYRKIARKYGRIPYDKSMERAYLKYKAR